MVFYENYIHDRRFSTVILANSRKNIVVPPDQGRVAIIGVDVGQESFAQTDACARTAAQEGHVYVPVDMRGLGEAMRPHLPGRRRIKASDAPLTAAGLAMSYARLSGAKQVVLPFDYHHLMDGLNAVEERITERADADVPVRVECVRDGGRTGTLYDLRQGEPRGSVVFLSGGPDSQMVLDRTIRQNVPQEKPTTSVHIDFGQPAQGGEQSAVNVIVSKLAQSLGDRGFRQLFRHVNISVPHIQKAFEGMGEFGYVILRNIIETAYFMGTDVARLLGAEEIVHANLYEDVVDLPWLGDFFQGLDAFAKEKRRTRVQSPVIDTPKGQLFEMAYDNGIRLVDSHSCLRGGDQHCGECRACKRRQTAFTTAHVADDTVYTLH